MTNLTYRILIPHDKTIFTNGFEIETYLDSINIEDGVGKEIVLQITKVRLSNKGIFYTDSNGMEM